MNTPSDFLLPQRQIQRANIAVSVIGLGTTKFGRNQAVKYPSAFDLPSDERILELLHIATIAGINLIDTAPAYGASEERLGRLLKQREKWIIATKVGEQFIDRQSVFDFTPRSIKKSLQMSCTRLSTDYLDIVQIHSDGRDVEILQSEVWEALTAAKKQGMTRAIGASIKTPAGFEMCLDLPQLDCVMIEYNPLLPPAIQLHYQLLIAKANSLGIGVLVKKAFGSGHLVSSKMEPNKTPRSPCPSSIDDNLRFCLQEAINSVVIGTINPLHLQENISTVQRICQELTPSN